LVVTAGAAAQPVRYTVATISVGDGYMPYAMSRGGMIAGTQHIGGSAEAFLWDGASFHGLGGGAAAGTWAYGVNDSGTIVGDVYGLPWGRPFIADRNHGLREFSPLGGRLGMAYGINNSGTVVGWASLPGQDEVYRPFAWREGAGAELPLPLGDAHGVAFGVSDSGLVVGRTWSEAGERPVLWAGGVPTVLPVPGQAAGAIPRHVNDSGMAAGILYWNGGETTRAVVWEGLTPSVLPSLGGTCDQVYGLNAAGQVVGSSEVGGENRAALWTGGAVFDLNELLVGIEGARLFAAQGIDDSGRIIAYGTIGDQFNSLVLLTPVPGPGSMAVVAELVLLAARRRR
jgi:probable HAF family extracellular repeat protein